MEHSNPMLKMRASTVARICEAKFDELTQKIPEQARKLKKVLAGIVMERTVSDVCSTMKVVAIGAGTKIAIEPSLNAADGNVVLDCHAEILCRRAFLRYLYDQLDSCVQGGESAALEQRSSTEKYGLKSGVSFHLYISTNPCGDAAVFRDDDDGDAHPNRANRGKARIKVDAGMGGSLASNAEKSKRFAVMSCSDKVARWNYLGIQGTLLSVFLEPIYLDSITIGNDFNPAHNCRALYERLKGTEQRGLYHLHCPVLSTVSGVQFPKRCAGTPEYGVNWTEGDGDIEMIKCTSGRTSDQMASPSRVCKKQLFGRYLRLKSDMRPPTDPPSKRKRLNERGEYRTSGISYSHEKARAVEHIQAKQVFNESFQRRCGAWLSNAIRFKVDSFTIED